MGQKGEDLRLFKRKPKKAEFNASEYFITPTWKLSSLADALDAMEISRRTMFNRCLKEFGFIPNEIHLDKTSWLLGACLSMVHSPLADVMWLSSDVEMIRNSSVEPGTMMIANSFVRLAVTLERGKLVRRML